MRWRGLALALSLVLLAAGCKDLLGLPRIHLMTTSPDGRWAALVRNHPTIDGPNQTLHIRDNSGGVEKKILRLGEDSQWCNRIEWEKDSSSVVFFVQGTAGFLLRVDPVTGKYVHQ